MPLLSAINLPPQVRVSVGRREGFRRAKIPVIPMFDTWFRALTSSILFQDIRYVRIGHFRTVGSTDTTAHSSVSGREMYFHFF